ncbi:MAG: DNA topoisomerase I [Nanoarchaeota archaeon]
MVRKKHKPIEQTTAENFFPVDEKSLIKVTEKIEAEVNRTEILRGAVTKVVKENIDDFKQTTEKNYKKPEQNALQKVEQQGDPNVKTYNNFGKKKRFSKKKTKSKKAFKKTSNNQIKKDFSPQKISLKQNGYELIITEKPQAAAKIAAALGTARQISDANRVPYYKINRDGKEIVVACAVGHLMTLQQNVRSSQVPIFDISWVPNFYVKKGDFSKRYYDTILKLAKDAGSITIATDYDVEGEVIGLNVVRYLCNQQDASRMKFSTLTSKELNNAYESKSPTINWGQAIAGETRHYLDWFYGINLSRALMNAIKSTGRFKIMSIGRVQGPTLKLIVDKEREIRAFVSEPYWQIFITAEDKSGTQLELKYNKDIFDKSLIKNFDNLVGRTGKAETTRSLQILPPNPPFNLSGLQSESYRLFGINPARTLQIAQSLYLSGLISYPRTSSQKLPAAIGYQEILEKVAKEFNATRFLKRKTPVEGPQSDPAHPSIYPTGNFQTLSGEDEKIYNLIAQRFLALFCEDAEIDNKNVKVRIENIEGYFIAKGSEIRKKGWMEIYPIKMKEKEIPDLSGIVNIINSKIEEKETQPPKRFTPASIVTELEKRNLGTKATRASIVETLYDRGYIKEKSIEATPIGMALIETLEKHSPIIIDEELTRNFENEIEIITEENKKTEELKKEENKILDEAKKTITKISEQFQKEEKEIGQELVQAQDDLREIEKEQNTIMKCPQCKEGNLTIRYSKNTRRYFVGCSNYPSCKATYSLPPNALIKNTGKTSENNLPLLLALRKGKRPWEFEFNPNWKKENEGKDKEQ